jgi:hypothetical protein
LPEYRTNNNHGGTRGRQVQRPCCRNHPSIAAPADRVPAAKGNRVTSVVSLRTFANSASHALDDIPAEQIHRAVSKISGLYGEVYETTDWIASTLPRKLGIGKNASG